MINRLQNHLRAASLFTVSHSSGNVIGGKVVLIRNFSKDIGSATYIMDVGIKTALGIIPLTRQNGREIDRLLEWVQ